MTSTDVRDERVTALSFPPGFVFGAATAAYQIEGAVTADGRGRSIWDTFSHTPGRTHRGETGDVAVDHYRRYRTDVALMADLGLDAYRFSVAWPRIMPEGGGRVEQRGLDFYRALVDELLTCGIDPWLTLYHWDLPQTLQDGGGWANRDTAARFADYATVVVDALGDRVRHWSTLNEPMCSALLGYQSGEHAPGERNSGHAARSVHHLLLGHGLATAVLRDRGVADVGVTLNFTLMRAASDAPADLDAARRLDGQQNRLFLEPIVTGAYPADVEAHLAASGAPLPIRDGDLAIIAAPVDWLGVNYYFSSVVRGESRPRRASPWIGCPDVEDVEPAGPTTSMGWGISPADFTELLLRLRDTCPELPLVITENGSAWPDEVTDDGLVPDTARTDYLLSHLDAVTAAVTAGADVRGYFAWSLLDNFEWARGYDQRFGLIHVDFATQQRTVKTSGLTYAEVIRRHRETTRR